jgi:hypothetical protein
MLSRHEERNRKSESVPDPFALTISGPSLMWKKVAAGIVLVVLSLAALITAVDYAIQERLEAIHSPNGQRSIVFEGEKILTIRIIDKGGKMEARINTHASRVMKWRLRWDGNDRIALESGDIGRRAWRFDRSVGWVEEGEEAADSTRRH